ncbi:peptidase/hydrolase [Kutzneria albida DSM 43870]|uniref:Peptidase/hydrolase n=2 Tax=Kutzneria TaxID=43356 RepID=W5WBG4_9PSEU|nr:peptidase/hydrolase [Kutzneria albida DSM 43870]
MLAAALVLSAAASGAAVTPASAGTEQARTINWRPCVENAQADCGTLTVPIDWANPALGTIDLALARRKATDPAHRIGSVVVDPGGPGGPGAEWVATGSVLSEQVRQRFDVIGFDPRGVTKSHALTCDRSVLTQVPTTDPGTPQGFADLVAYNRRVAENCRHNSGPLYDHVDDLSVVRDIDAIRAAVGDRKLTYYGTSYGTLMGQQYAELFPDRVRALVLDSNMDHSLPGADFFRTEAATAEDGFTEFTKWCAANTACALHGQDLGTVFDQLRAKAERGELHLPGSSQVLTPMLLTAYTTSYLYGPDWARLANWLKSASEGGQLTASSVPDEQQPFYPQASFCSDWTPGLDSAATVAAQRRADAVQAPHLRLSGLAWRASLNCVGHPVRTTNPPHRYRTAGAPPILMVNSLHDPATPYAWAQHAASQIPSATLLTYEGWGHVAYDKSPCVAALTDQYLVTLELPAKGTRCAAVPPATTAASAPRAVQF